MDQRFAPARSDPPRGSSCPGDIHDLCELNRYRRKAAQMRAAVAFADKIEISVWHMLTDGTLYRELGAAFLDKMDRERTEKHLLPRLIIMGFEVRPLERAA